MRTADEVRALMPDLDRSITDMFGISDSEFRDRYVALADKLNEIWWSAPSYYTDVKLAAAILDDVVGYHGYTASQLLNFTCFVRMISILLSERVYVPVIGIKKEEPQQ